MLNYPKIAVIILNFNSSDFLKPIVYDSIESALSIKYPKIDVVLVDNNSKDGSYEAIIDRFGKDVISIRLPKNYGYAGGNEYGFQVYSSQKGIPDYVLFMNNDYCLINPDVATNFIHSMEAREDIMLAGGFNLKEDKSRLLDAGCFVDSFTHVVGRYSDFRIDESPQKYSYVTFVSGSCFFVKVKKLLRIRGFIFDPKIFSFWDETELALHLWTYGYRSIFLPIVAGIHYGSKSFSKFSELSLYLLTKNRYAVLRHYFGKKLKLHSTSALSRSLMTLPLRPLQGAKGKIIAKAVYDSLKLSFKPTGKFYPALVVPRGLSNCLKQALPFPRNYYAKILNKIATLTIDENQLKSSSMHYAIPIDP